MMSPWVVAMACNVHVITVYCTDVVSPPVTMEPVMLS